MTGSLRIAAETPQVHAMWGAVEFLNIPNDERLKTAKQDVTKALAALFVSIERLGYTNPNPRGWP